MNYPKSARVLKRFEFLKFYQRSEVKRLDSCVVFRIQNELPNARLGLTVKSKKGSVVRNQLKRSVRECFRERRHQMGSFDYNVVIHVPAHLDKNGIQMLRRRVVNTLSRLWDSPRSGGP